jgi:hypothetical protein
MDHEKIRERAMRAQEVSRRYLLTHWTPFVRMFSRNPKMLVQLTGGTPRTDGRTTWLRVPIELGDDTPHDKAVCGQRASDFTMLCPACDVLDEATCTIFHEAGHTTEGSFDPLSEYDRRRIIVEAIKLEADGKDDSSRAKKIVKRIEENIRFVDSYIAAASLVSPFLPMITNVIEDVWVNARIQTERPGTVPMFQAKYSRVFSKGIEQIDGKTVLWSDQPLNAQAVIGVYCLGTKVDLDGRLDPKVVADMGDPEINALVAEIPRCISAELRYKLSIKVLEALRRLGYCKSADDPEDDPKPEPGEGEGSGEAGGEAEPDDDDAEDGDGADDAEDGEAGDDDSGESGSDGDESSDGDDEASDAEGDGEGDGGEARDDDDEEGGDTETIEEPGDSSSDHDFPDPTPTGKGADDGDKPDSDEPFKGADDDTFGDEGTSNEPSGDDGESGHEGGEAGFPPDANFGEPTDVDDLFKQFGQHDKDDEPATPEEQKEAEEVERALNQGQHFDNPSENLIGLEVIRPEDERSHGHAFGRGSGHMPTIPPAILSPALLKARIAFTNNKRGKRTRNLETGNRLDGHVLARRLAVGDTRVFEKRSRPGKRDYFVVIGLDVSGSTRSGNVIELIKLAAMAQAELLSKLGIKFAVYAHTGNHDKVLIHEVKSAREPWGNKQREALGRISSYSANLDGHTLEFYRKVLDKQTATDRICLYYTDGAMPAENYDEELDILQREIKLVRRKGYLLLAVGVRNDDPQQYGLDMVRLDRIEDVPKVVEALRKRLS